MKANFYTVSALEKENTYVLILLPVLTCPALFLNKMYFLLLLPPALGPMIKQGGLFLTPESTDLPEEMCTMWPTFSTGSCSWIFSRAPGVTPCSVCMATRCWEVSSKGSQGQTPGRTGTLALCMMASKLPVVVRRGRAVRWEKREEHLKRQG